MLYKYMFCMLPSQIMVIQYTNTQKLWLYLLYMLPRQIMAIRASKNTEVITIPVLYVT